MFIYQPGISFLLVCHYSDSVDTQDVEIKVSGKKREEKHQCTVGNNEINK